MIKKRYKDNKVAYLLLAPWLVGFIGMWLIPMCISIYYSFTDFNLLNDPQFIGAANYVRAFTQDKTFYKALKVTFLYVLLLVPLRLAFALFVAMLLNKKHRGLGHNDSDADTDHFLQSDSSDHQRFPCVYRELCNYGWRTAGQHLIVRPVPVPSCIYVF